MPVHLNPIKQRTNWWPVKTDMRYLVTGAAGQLGSEWVCFLRSKGADFQAYGSGEMDITDPSVVDEKIGTYHPDIVINCAAYTNVDKAEDEQEIAFRVNKTGVQNLVESCSKTGCKLIHYSTDYVFPGKRRDVQKYPDGYTEDSLKRPVNVYGASKREGEVVLENSDIEYLMIRVSWLCGPDGSNFVNTMLRLARENKELSIVNDQLGSPSFTFDVVEKTASLIEMGKTGTYHISTKGLISWAGFAGEIFRQSGIDVLIQKIPSSQFPTKAKRPFFSYLSTAKMEKDGLKTVDWKTGLSELLEKQNDS